MEAPRTPAGADYRSDRLGGRLDSWKEIAAYLQRDVTTVQRWEKRERLPIHRHQHDRQGTVFAYQSELDAWLANRVRPADEAPRVRRAVRPRAWLGLAIAIALLASAVAAVVSVSRQVVRNSVPPLPRFSLFPPPLQSFGHLALSGDGRTLAFVTASSLHVRRLDELNARAIPDTESAEAPFWSPDGDWIAYFSGRELVRVKVSGGSPQTLAPAPRALGGTWSTRGVIVFSRDRGEALYRVADRGGTPVALRRASERKGWLSLRWPHFLPDGNRFLYFVRSNDPEIQGIYVGSLQHADASTDRRVTDAESNAFYSAGHLGYVRRGTLMAQPFDLARARTTDSAFPIVERIDQDPYDDGFALFTLSVNGVLAYRGGITNDRQLRWFDRDGRQTATLGPPGEYRDLALSRDGTRLAYERMDPQLGTRDIWIEDLERGGQLRLTSNAHEDGAPVWSPDGTELTFGAIRDRQVRILREAATGGAERLLLNAIAVPVDWSPDGRFVAVELTSQATGTDIVLLDVESRQLTPYLATPASDRHAQFSPDGSLMAYSSSESGQRHVYIEPVPRDGRRWRASTGYGREPRWRGDGRELFYLASDDTLMSVPVEPTAGGVTLGKPVSLFKMRIRAGDVRFHYAVEPSGNRFLVNTVVEDVPGTPINVFVDWLLGTRGTR
jgi:Tol biopolymer transport system component